MTSNLRLRRVRLLWTRLLDVVRPKRDYAGRYPRIQTLSEAEEQRLREILRRWDHDV